MNTVVLNQETDDMLTCRITGKGEYYRAKSYGHPKAKSRVSTGHRATIVQSPVALVKDANHSRGVKRRNDIATPNGTAQSRMLQREGSGQRGRFRRVFLTHIIAYFDRTIGPYITHIRHLDTPPEPLDRLWLGCQ
jgi:hypothetical protein